MAQKPQKLTVFITPNAHAALDRIWNWNSERYSGEHADRYITFLIAAVGKLGDEPFAGKQVPTRPEMNYITIRRSRKRHGHVAVYELVDGVIRVIDFFHTAQDWQSILVE